MLGVWGVLCAIAVDVFEAVFGEEGVGAMLGIGGV